MHKSEQSLVNRYSATELAGALQLGRWARKVDDHHLRAQLTYHCYDEARHSKLWMEFLDTRGYETSQVHDRNDYFAHLARQDDVIYFLAGVHVYEHRVPFHFEQHLKHPNIDPNLATLMEDIKSDEKYHLGWVQEYFESLSGEKRTAMEQAIQEMGKLEQDTYEAYTKSLYEGDEYLRKLGEIIDENLEQYTYPWTKYVSN